MRITKQEYSACERLYNETMAHGIDMIISHGIVGGFIKDKNEGVRYYLDVLEGLEIAEEYEMCHQLYNLILAYKKDYGII